MCDRPMTVITLSHISVTIVTVMYDIIPFLFLLNPKVKKSKKKKIIENKNILNKRREIGKK